MQTPVPPTPADPAAAEPPRVEFRVGLGDVLGYCCALLRSATAKGARPVVCGPAPAIEELDQRLWTFAPAEFLPHCRVGDALEGRSPIVLSAHPDIEGLRGRDCLVNLGPSLVQGWRRVPRVIELVGADDAAKASARQRFRVYRDGGCAPRTLETGHEAR